MNDAANIKLLLADVDGTLVTKEKVLTDRACKAVADLKAKGIRFAITSGRPPRGMKTLIEPLHIDTPVAGFNGGLFTRPDFTTIEERTLAPDVAKKTVETLLARGLDCWVYAGEDWYVRDPKAPHAERESRTVNFQATVIQDLYSKLDKAVKIVGISDDLKLVEQVEKELQETVGKDATAARSQPYYLDVTNRDANKGAVLAYLCKEYSLEPHQIATIGDMPNDVLMFEPSGFSIAMGNASDDVKAKATTTTDSNENDGFAKAVETNFLNA